MATQPSTTTSEAFKFRWTSKGLDEENALNGLLWTDWNALLDIAKEVSGDPNCAYEGTHCTSNRYVQRRIKLPATGALWLARVLAQYGKRPNQFSRFNNKSMLSDIVTMKFLAEHSDIPVPQVFAYNVTSKDNLVTWPWILMECIKGNTLSDLGYNGPVAFKPTDGLKELNDEQKAKVRKELASFQVKLSNVGVETIGTFRPSTDKNPPVGSYNIGILSGLFGTAGPFSLAPEWFTEWSIHAHWYPKRWQQSGYLKPGDRQLKEAFLKRLASEINLIIPDELSESYCLTIPDFGNSNLLFNDELELVGVVNWEASATTPIDVSVAVMNVYAKFKPEIAGAFYDEEAKNYIADVAAAEDALGLPRKISHRFGSAIGDIGVCMVRFGDHEITNYDAIFNRAPRIV